MRADITQEIEEATGKIDLANERLEEAKQWDMKTWSTGAKDAVNSLLKIQVEVTELEGHSRRNNIRLYGVRPTTEGTSMINFVGKLIKSELGEDIPPAMDLGIERAHRALGMGPPDNATPRCTVIKFTTKENVIHTAWKKPITFEGKQLSFDHDYTTEVLPEQKDITIKKTKKKKASAFRLC